MLKEVTPVRLLKGVQGGFFDQVAKAEAEGESVDFLRTLLGRGRAKRGMQEGDLQEGELEIGQVSALLNDVPRAADLMAQLVADYRSFGTSEMSPGFSWNALS